MALVAGNVDVHRRRISAATAMYVQRQRLRSIVRRSGRELLRFVLVGRVVSPRLSMPTAAQQAAGGRGRMIITR